MAEIIVKDSGTLEYHTTNDEKIAKTNEQMASKYSRIIRKCIEELISDETKLTIFKSLNDLGPNYMYKMFTKNSHFTERNLRNTTTELRLPWRKSTVGQKSFSYRGAKVWNSLSTECNETTSLQVFKSFLKKM